MPALAHLLGERRRGGAAAVCALLADELEVALERAYPLREQRLLLPLSLHRPPCRLGRPCARARSAGQAGSIGVATENGGGKPENAREWVGWGPVVLFEHYSEIMGQVCV